MSYIYEQRKTLNFKELKEFLERHKDDDAPLFIHTKPKKPRDEIKIWSDAYWTGYDKI